MTKPFQEWTVLPHGKLTRLDKNLLSVTGVLDMPMGEVNRRMTVARLGDGRLVIYSAIALDEAEMRALESFGTPTYLIVPSDIHRLDAKTWKDRYPAIQVIAPAGAQKKVEELLPVDAVTVDFGDPSVIYFTVAGTAQREAALLVKTESGITLVLNDLIFDLANRPGISGWLFKTIGMTGDEPHIPAFVKMREVKDEDALRAELERFSRMPELNRVIISHGNIIGGDAPRVLERIAASL
ncbi:MAG: hypothetical protein ABI183_19345 [Polyangiaceae bacterium]